MIVLPHGLVPTVPVVISRRQLPRPLELFDISGEVVDSGIRVHSQLGPGLLESAYLTCLVHELRLRGLRVERQVAIPLCYEGLRVPAAYRIDLLVERAVIVEVKAVKALHPIHYAQLLSYLRLTNLRLGLLINFSVLHLRDGIKRLANDL
jgi:GxxExxY protein